MSHILQTEYDFKLPKGYVDKEGNVHRSGTMRLATAEDEILPMRDHRVQSVPAYLIVILLARVIRLGSVEVNAYVIEHLFSADLAYLQDMYNRINAPETRWMPVQVQCPHCNHAFEAEVPLMGGS